LKNTLSDSFFSSVGEGAVGWLSPAAGFLPVGGEEQSEEEEEEEEEEGTREGVGTVATSLGFTGAASTFEYTWNPCKRIRIEMGTTRMRFQED
jgi:hypothetical protein